MTPISHSFFGFTTGFILAPITHKFDVSHKRTVILCTLGAVIPDIDSISLILNREIYFGSNWYSHHGLSHSIFGVFLIEFALMLIFQPMLTLQSLKSKSALKIWITSLTILFICSLIHLFCDMVTLPGAWKGVPIFSPFSWYRFGGWAYIPWKDYYLIYLSISTYLIFTTIWIVEFLFKKRTHVLPIISFMILSWVIYYTYNSKFTNYYEWEKEQKHLVGEELYQLANKVEMKIARF